MPNPDRTFALEHFAQAQAAWAAAVKAHLSAPPDAGFSARLAALARACQLEADACRESDRAGYEWPPHRAAKPDQPWELRPESGRRGPTDLWRVFDAAVRELEYVATRTSLLDVAVAHERLGDAAAALAAAVEAEDRLAGRHPSAASPTLVPAHGDDPTTRSAPGNNVGGPDPAL